MKKVKSLLNKMSSPRNVVGDLLLTKLFVSKVFSLFITTQSAEDSRQRPSGMTGLLDVKAFTLVELLVVVLIIGILSAVAIPMYQGAVDKSHWSTMLPGAKAIKDAEEAIKLTNGEYSSQMDDLDVTMNNDDLIFDLSQTPSNGIDADVIRVTNGKLGGNVRLASYLDDSPKFAGQLHCEALRDDNRANRLCGKLLGGDELTSQDNYIAYLLDQSVTKEICGDANLVWSNKQTKCYKTEEDRCTANGMPYENGFCGYTNAWGASGPIVIEEGASCLVTNWAGCNGDDMGNNFLVKPGGKCVVTIPIEYSSCARVQVDGGEVICSYEGGNYCGINSRFDHGGICLANSWRACWTTSFKNGSICYANINAGCDHPGTSYDETSCCCGNYCGDKPKCSADRCAEVKAQYADYLN